MKPLRSRLRKAALRMQVSQGQVENAYWKFLHRTWNGAMMEG
jgi:hypothetical protein